MIQNTAQHVKRFETFKTCFFESVYIGLQEVPTNFLWSDPDDVGVTLRKMF